MYPEPVIKWKSWPFIERPFTSFFLVVFLAALALFVYWLAVINWHQPIYYVLGMLLILGSLLPYFIRTDYEMYEDKYIIRYLFLKISRPYSDFGCFYLDKRGIMLSTFKMPRRLDPFRGQSLRFSADGKERVQLVELLKAKIGKQY